MISSLSNMVQTAYLQSRKQNGSEGWISVLDMYISIHVEYLCVKNIYSFPSPATVSIFIESLVCLSYVNCGQSLSPAMKWKTNSIDPRDATYVFATLKANKPHCYWSKSYKKVDWQVAWVTGWLVWSHQNFGKAEFLFIYKSNFKFRFCISLHYCFTYIQRAFPALDNYWNCICLVDLLTYFV